MKPYNFKCVSGYRIISSMISHMKKKMGGAVQVVSSGLQLYIIKEPFSSISTFFFNVFSHLHNVCATSWNTAISIYQKHKLALPPLMCKKKNRPPAGFLTSSMIGNSFFFLLCSQYIDFLYEGEILIKKMMRALFLDPEGTSMNPHVLKKSQKNHHITGRFFV